MVLAQIVQAIPLPRDTLLPPRSTFRVECGDGATTTMRAILVRTSYIDIQKGHDVCRFHCLHSLGYYDAVSSNAPTPTHECFTLRVQLGTGQTAGFLPRAYRCLLSCRLRLAWALSISSSRYSSGRSKSASAGSGTGWPQATTVRPFRRFLLRAASRW